MRAASIKWHRKLAWVAGICAIGWALTGMLHPIMVWTSPVAAARMPPLVPLDLSHARPPATLLAGKVPDQMAEMRAVVLAGRSYYAVKRADDPVRFYFDPETGEERTDGDRDRAVELARHYLGDPDTPARDARIVTSFDNEYTPVNRLLPVWRVELARDDGLVAYIDTGSGRMAAITDAGKRSMQALFRTIHTLSFIPGEAGPLRAVAMTLLVGSIAVSSLLGIVLLLLIRRRNRAPGGRHWHRLLGYAAALPALAFTLSGLWHLLLGQDGSTDASPALRPQSLELATLTSDLAGLWQGFGPDTAPVALSFLAAPDGSALLRLVPPPTWSAAPAAAADSHHGHEGHGDGQHDHGPQIRPAAQGDHRARLALFQGIPTGGSGVLLTAADMRPLPGNEGAAARALARTLGGAPVADDAQTSLVTRFGADYGFANKRLPVWRVELPDDRALFVDLADATIAATTAPGLRRAGWVFDIFHKGGFMDTIGPVARDIILMVAALLIAALSAIGLSLLVRRR